LKTDHEKERTIKSKLTGLLALFVFLNTSSFWIEKDLVISSFMLINSILFVFIASFGRMWCSLYIAGFKDNKLVTDGPYSMCRNPLYFFSFIGMIGIGFSTRTFSFPFIFVILYCLNYPSIIKAEENRLGTVFGIKYEEYRKAVPCFFPNFSNFKEPDSYVMNPVVYRSEMLSAVWFVLFLGLIETINVIKNMGMLKSVFILY